MFKVSDDKVVAGSQVWTVGLMVKLYEDTFSYSTPPRCALLVCGRIFMKQQDTSRQLSTPFLFDILAYSHHCGSIGVSSNGCLVWHEFQKQKIVVMIFPADFCTRNFFGVGDPLFAIAWTLVWSLDHEDGPMFHPL